MKIDLGSGAVSLLLLACVLAVFLSIAVPIVIDPKEMEIGDWLGFAGNVLAGSITLLAAVIAWRAVQHQIAAQKEQTNIELLLREETRLGAQINGLQQCIRLLAKLTIAAREGIDPNGLIACLDDQIGAGPAVTVDIRKALELRMGATPPDVLFDVASRLYTARLDAAALLRSNPARADFEEREERFRRAVLALGRLRTELGRRFARDRHNLQRFRRRIETAIDEI